MPDSPLVNSATRGRGYVIIPGGSYSFAPVGHAVLYEGSSFAVAYLRRLD